MAPRGALLLLVLLPRLPGSVLWLARLPVRRQQGDERRAAGVRRGVLPVCRPQAAGPLTAHAAHLPLPRSVSLTPLCFGCGWTGAVMWDERVSAAAAVSTTGRRVDATEDYTKRGISGSHKASIDVVSALCFWWAGRWLVISVSACTIAAAAAPSRSAGGSRIGKSRTPPLFACGDTTTHVNNDHSTEGTQIALPEGPRGVSDLWGRRSPGHSHAAVQQGTDLGQLCLAGVRSKPHMWTEQARRDQKEKHVREEVRGTGSVGLEAQHHPLPLVAHIVHLPNLLIPLSPTPLPPRTSAIDREAESSCSRTQPLV
jgi:hypothetical protein